MMRHALHSAQRYFRPEQRSRNSRCLSRSSLLGLATLLLVAGLSVPVLASDPLLAAAQSSSRILQGRLMAASAAGDNLVAVGPYGRIAVSADGGKSWQQAQVPVSSDLVAVNFPSARQGWAVGHDGVILHSADGGRTWSKQLDGYQAVQLLRDYYAANNPLPGTDVEALQAEVQRFVDEGADKPFLDVHFLDEQEGFVVGAFNLGLRTRDGGKTWQPLNDRTDNSMGLHLYGLGVSRGELFLAGESGLLRRWDRRQERFVALSSPYEGSFFGILGSVDSLLAYGMRGNAFLSRDGGKSWSRLITNTTASLNAGALLEDGRRVLVSEEGDLFLARDDQFSRLSSRRGVPFYGVAPAGDKAVVLVGRRGVSVETLN